MANTWTTLLDAIYPVGSIYITGSTTSPATSFGGTWTQVKSGLLGCAGSDGLADNLKTGGSSTISVVQMPNHNHLTTETTVIYNRSDQGGGIVKVGSGTGATFYQGQLSTTSTGDSEAYYPAHISFNVYRRTA